MFNIYPNVRFIVGNLVSHHCVKNNWIAESDCSGLIKFEQTDGFVDNAEEQIMEGLNSTPENNNKQ